MGDLAQKKCLPCEIGTPPLKGKELADMVKQLPDDWKLIEEKKIEKEYRFKNFKEALEFVNEIGKIAEEEGHHPDLFLAWGRVKVTLMTHRIHGLTESDFIMAAKIDVTFLSR